MMMERTLPADWRPDDAPGADLSFSTLHTRCFERKLSLMGSKSEMIERYDQYQQFRAAEKRRFSWQAQPSDPLFERTYERTLRSADCTKFRIVRAKDKGGLNGGHITKHFLVTHEGDKLFQVEFDREPWCTCGELRPTCVHIIYVLRYVLNCPEPLRWQYSFLTTELEDIYRHSYAVSTLLLTDWKGQDPLCALCFKTVVPTEGHRTCCVRCGRAMHTECVGVAQKARGLIIAVEWKAKRAVNKEQCLRCYDETEWGINKFYKPGQVKYPLVVPGTKAAPQTLPGPGGNTAQQQNERAASDAVGIEGLGSSRGEHSGQQANNPPPTDADPTPGTATAPASATTPDGALAPASGTDSVENPASASTNTHSSDRDSAKLVRDRGSLAKESAEMRKRAKREYKKLNKKLKKLRKKSKRELERLMKKSKKLEKRARGLGRQEEGSDNV